jgi:hypothetical protein
MEGTTGCGSLRPDGLRSVTDLWEICGSTEGAWIRKLLGKQLQGMVPGGSVHGWPERKNDFDFVREHISGERMLFPGGGSDCTN